MFVGYLPFDNSEQRTREKFKSFPIAINSFLEETIVRMFATNPKKRPSADKILSVMEKEFREIKKGIEWKVEGKKMLVSGLGPIPDCSEKAPWEEERDSIQSITLKRGLNEIRNFAFSNLFKLTAVELHSDLKKVGWGVFMSCTELKSITTPDSDISIGISAFDNCTSG